MKTLHSGCDIITSALQDKSRDGKGRIFVEASISYLLSMISRLAKCPSDSELYRCFVSHVARELHALG